METLPEVGSPCQHRKPFVLDNGRARWVATPNGGAGGRGDPVGSLVSCAYPVAVHLQLFPDAVIKEQHGRVWAGKSGGGKRGKINGLSEHAAARQREFLTTWHVPGREPWAVTLTKRVPVTWSEWAVIWNKFRCRLRRCLTAAVWNGELQRRGVPHVHAAVWFLPWPSPDVQGQERQQEFEFVFEHRDVWRKGWLDSITKPQLDGRVVYDRAEYFHAVHMRPIEDNGWAIYQALHNSKRKREQSGWKGKCWGVIGREFFRRRRPVQLDLSLRQYWVFRRLVSRLLRSRGTRRYKLPAHGKWLRCIESDVVERLVTWCKLAAAV